MTPIPTQINPSLFQVSDPGKVYINSSFEEQLQILLDGIKEEKEIFLISGKQGSGRKALIKKAIYEIQDKALLVNIKQENFDYEKLIDITGKNLEKNFSTDSPLEEKITRIKELLKKKSIQHVAVLFDQTEGFKRTVIENGLLLVNSSLSESCFFHLFITGLPDFSDQLKKSGFPVSILSDSISFQVQPLSFNDIRSYIQHHIQHVDDQEDEIFSEEAIKQIIKYSKGLPGLINRLCSLGLLTANLEEKSSVSLEMIDEVLENSLFLGNEFDYTSVIPEDNSFSEKESMDDSVTFNNTSAQIPPKPEHTPKSTKPVAKNQEQPFVQKKPDSQDPLKTDVSAMIYEEATRPEELDRLSDKGSAIVSRGNTEKVKELDLDNLINSVRAEKRDEKIEQRPIAEKKEREPVRVVEQKTVRIEQKPAPIEERETIKYKSRKRHAPAKAKRELSDKSPLFSAFSMGVIFSTLVATGLYFFLPKNQGNLENTKEVISDLFLAKKEKPQQLEARLDYLEKELKNRKTSEIDGSATKISKQDKEDYLSHLPATAAGGTKTKQDEQNIADAKVKQSETFSPQEAKNRNIEKLLSVAEQQLDNKKLMIPVDDSAWGTYNKILALAPNNQDAKSGITKIRDTYILWARHEIKKGTPEHATYLFKKALEISPGDPEILSAIITLEGKPSANTESNSTAEKAKAKSIKGSGAFSKSNLFRLLDTPKGIEKLLAIAELQVSRKNLTTPERNSAFTIYKIILKRFPRHRSALDGLKTIKETYIDWAKLEIAQGNYQLAESFYSNALKISPDDPEIVSNLDQLRKTINR